MDKTIFIVEGIDRVGKSVFCEKLSKATGIVILKDKYFWGYESHKVNIEKMHSLLNAAETFETSFITDRFHYTELVYGIIERENSYYKSFDSKYLLEEKMSEMINSGWKIKLIYVMPTDIVLSSKQHEKDLNRHNEMFKELFNEDSIFDKYLCTYKTIDDTIKLITI